MDPADLLWLHAQLAATLRSQEARITELEQQLEQVKRHHPESPED